jgi:hypothetical protein
MTVMKGLVFLLPFLSLRDPARANGAQAVPHRPWGTLSSQAAADARCRCELFPFSLRGKVARSAGWGFGEVAGNEKCGADDRLTLHSAHVSDGGILGLRNSAEPSPQPLSQWERGF